MDDDDGLMIIGAKKKNTLKNDDKHDLDTCVNNFKNFILGESEDSMVLSKKLSEIGLAGDVDKYFIRPTIWKCFLNVLPINPTAKLEEWVNTISKQRSVYKSKLKSLNALKKFSGDPLGGGSNDSGWNSFFEENELKKIINLDVNRTYQDKDLFQTTVIKELLVNILFIWSKDNKDISYKQGMNELLAVLLFGIYPFYFINTQSKQSQESIMNLITNQGKSMPAKEIYLFFHDQDEIASDLFFLFDAVMNKGIKDLYESGNYKKSPQCYKKYDLFQPQWTEEEDPERDQLPLQRRCSLIIKEKLKVIDEELYNHFIKIDLNCAIFLQRWLKCIFNREFHPRDVIVLWDSIISHDLLDSTSLAANESYSFMFIDFMAVAMINYIREDLLRKDQNDCFQRLFKYPPIESPITLIKLANQIKDLLFKNKNKRKKDLSTTQLPNKSFKKNNSSENYNLTEDKKNNGFKSSPLGGSNIITNTSNSNVINKEKDPQTNKTNLKINNGSLSVSNSVPTHKANESEESYKMVERLEEIHRKYKNNFEQEDSLDFQSIIETLKINLSNSD